MRALSDEQSGSTRSLSPAAPSAANEKSAASGPARGPQRQPLPKDSLPEGLANTAGWLFGWPWIDPVILWALNRWFFPLSRLWAAADGSGAAIERFFVAVPLDPLRSPRYGLGRLLIHAEEARANALAVDLAWRRVFYAEDNDGVESTAEERLALERVRLLTSHRYNATRWDFRGLLRATPPRVRFDVPGPDEVAAVYGPALYDPAPLFAVPDPMPRVSLSGRIKSAHGHDYWLRFHTPSDRLQDDVFARVHEPAGVENPPTLIFGHGICVEFDQWRGLIDEAASLCARGVRVIRPEAPWHGRRRPRGYYGGERMVSTFPMGTLDLLSGAVREWAVLADWARQTSNGPLAFGGSSLGAMTAQLAADRARDWPRHLRPDALLLITHCWQFDAAIQQGELMRIWDGRQAVEAKGWDEQRVNAYLSLLAPGPAPALSPDRIVTVLGRRDRITPFASGAKLVERWAIPEHNRFIWDRGHFSIPVTLLRDPAPLERFLQILRD